LALAGCGKSVVSGKPTLEQLEEVFGDLPPQTPLLGSMEQLSGPGVNESGVIDGSKARLWIVSTRDPVALPFLRTNATIPDPESTFLQASGKIDPRTIAIRRDAFDASVIGSVLSACGVMQDDVPTPKGLRGHSYQWVYGDNTFHFRELETIQGWLGVIEILASK